MGSGAGWSVVGARLVGARGEEGMHRQIAMAVATWQAVGAWPYSRWDSKFRSRDANAASLTASSCASQSNLKQHFCSFSSCTRISRTSLSERMCTRSSTTCSKHAVVSGRVRWGSVDGFDGHPASMATPRSPPHLTGLPLLSSPPPPPRSQPHLTGIRLS